jgi:glycosyltransferase involved in cell wall biosynthesis
VGYLVSHPIQYQVPMLRFLAGQEDIDLSVFFMSDLSVGGYVDPGFRRSIRWDVPLLDGYKYAFLPTLGRRNRLSFWRPMGYGLGRLLKDGGLDALWVHGYAHQVTLRAIIQARAAGLPVLMRGETHLTSRRRSRAREWLKRRGMPRLFALVDAFLAIGTQNRRYYQHYGVPEERIFFVPYAVDNDFFRSRAADAAPLRDALRAELGLTACRPVILYASKLQARKRPSDLLEAYARLSPNRRSEPEAYLLFVGDGEERTRLEASVRSLGWSSVRFVGFKNQTELPRFYDLCDVFVLPSEHEPWGLVVNEVMNAGKPVVVSDAVGAAPDLVADGENGFVVPVGDVETLARRLACFVADPELRRAMGEASRRRVTEWSFEADHKGLVAALESVVDG